MATLFDTLETRYKANIIDFEREVARMQKISRTAGERIAADQNRQAQAAKSAWQKADIGGALQKSMSSGVSGAAAELAKLAPLLAAAFAGNAAIGAADAYTRFTNSLKVAGLSGQQLAGVQDHLYQTALRNNTSLDALATVYSRASMAAKELGVTQGQIADLTDTVAAATKISGKSTAEAAGAQLQLSQALSGGKVQAEEWGSIIDGLLPLIQGAAKASDKYGGSVAKMTADVKAGKLTSAEFSRLILASKDAMEALAGTATTTAAGALENFKTALTKAMGQANDTYGVTNQLTEALAWMSNNIGLLSTSLLVLAGVFGVSVAPAIGRATMGLIELATASAGTLVAEARLAAFQVTMANSMGGAAMGAQALAMSFKGLLASTGVGLLIVGVTTALGYFATEAMKASEETRKYEAELDRYREKTKDISKKTYDARLARDELTKSERKALTDTANLTGQVSLLADQYGRAAVEAKRLRLEQDANDIKDGHKVMARAMTEDDAAQRELAAANGKHDLYNTDPEMGYRASAQAKSNYEAAQKKAAKTASNRAAAKTGLKTRYDAYDNDRNEKITVNSPATAAPKPDKGAASAAASREAKGDSLANQTQKDLINAQRNLANTLDERHAANLAALDAELALANKRIDDEIGNKKLDEKDPDVIEARANVKAGFDLKKKAENDDHVRAIAERNAEIDSQRLDISLDAMRVEEEVLSNAASNARTTEEKHAYEKLVLAQRQKIDAEEFARAQAQKKVELEKLGLSQDEVNKMLAARQVTFDKQQTNDRNDQTVKQGREAPNWGGWLENLGTSSDSLQTKLQNLTANGISGVIDGLAEAGLNAKNLGGAFSSMAKSMLLELEKLAIKFLIFEALGMAFGVKGLGAKAVGLNKHAAGTNFAPGGLSLVGENGPELVGMPRGAQVVPNNLLKNAFQTPRGSNASGITHVTNNYRIDANNSLVTSQLQEMMVAASIQAAQAGRQGAQADIYKKGRQQL
jgi:tape measure domain-containing protein